MNSAPPMPSSMLARPAASTLSSESRNSCSNSAVGTPTATDQSEPGTRTVHDDSSSPECVCVTKGHGVCCSIAPRSESDTGWPTRRAASPVRPAMVRCGSTTAAVQSAGSTWSCSTAVSASVGSDIRSA